MQMLNHDTVTINVSLLQGVSLEALTLTSNLLVMYR